MFLLFLIIELVVVSVLMSMGMMMLPLVVVVSLPFKLIFFVLVDGWMLVVWCRATRVEGEAGIASENGVAS